MTEYLVITCGGTGGHFYPGLSIARTQQARGKKVMLLLSGKNSVEQKAIAEKFNIPCKTLPIMPSLSLRHPVNSLKFLWGLAKGVPQALVILKKEKPSAVLGMGSFASLPVILAATFLRLPVFLHDGNARIGKANRFLSFFAKVLATAFPAVNANKVHCKYVVSGMPVRPELKQEALSKAESIEALNAKFGCSLKSDYFTVLLFGGSQGARKLNQIFGEAVKSAAGKYKNIQLIQLTGAGEFDAMSKFYAEPDFPLLLLPTLAEMHWAFQASDLVISRSGGSTAAELNAFGKYAVVVPYPFAAELHQDDNADYLVSLNAAEKVNDCDLEANMALALVERLYNQKDIAELGKNSILPDAWLGAENMLNIIDKTLEEEK